MLNIFKSKFNNKNKIYTNNTEIGKYTRDYPPSVREWKNSIYLYNKNALSLIPESSKLALRFFKSYFNLHNHEFERKMRRVRLLRRFRRTSSHKIYVSHGEFKHTNNKVLITLYIYNKQKSNLFKKIKKRYIRKFKRRLLKRRFALKLKSLKLNVNLIKRRFMRNSAKVLLSINTLHKRKTLPSYLLRIQNKTKQGLNRKLNLNVFKSTLVKLDEKIDEFVVRTSYRNNTNKGVSVTEALHNLSINKRQLLNLIMYKKYLKRFFFKLKRKFFRRFKGFFRYKRLIYINKSKFSYSYLKQLVILIKKIYNKNVEFNLVNLKYFYLNSDILSQSVTLKVTRNRRRLLRTLNRSVRKPKRRRRYWIDPLINFKFKFPSLSNKDVLDNILHTEYPMHFLRKESNAFKPSLLRSSNRLRRTKGISLKRKTVLNLIKYKEITGIRLEAKGRLTRRYTASRSKYKARYRGNLRNTDSSFNLLPSLILRGNTRTNLQYTKLKSKSRIGSFGIKGWLSAT